MRIERWKRWLPVTVAMAGTWWIFTGSDIASWTVGGPAVVLIVVGFRRMAETPSYSVQLLGFLHFLPYFFVQSVIGGVDVARRALSPRMPLQTGFIEHPLRLPPGPQRVFFANCISLLPGTLSSQLSEASVEVHALQSDRACRLALATLEDKVGELFGLRDRMEDAAE